MTSVIIAFPKPEIARTIRNILIRAGYENVTICATGAQALSRANELSFGVVISAYRFSDMTYYELAKYMPDTFLILLISSKDITREKESKIIRLSMPLQVQSFVTQMRILDERISRLKKEAKDRPKIRSSKERLLIVQAKERLMKEYNLTEEQAHKKLQRLSMDTGKSLITIAKEVL